jgi:hypothetical protein
MDCEKSAGPEVDCRPLSFRKKCGLERGKSLGGGLPTG